MALTGAEKQRNYIARLKERAGHAPEPPDSASCDPVAVLKAIAVDPATPAGPRVAACKALLGLGLDTGKGETEEDRERTIAARAIAMLERRTLQ